MKTIQIPTNFNFDPPSASYLRWKSIVSLVFKSYDVDELNNVVKRNIVITLNDVIKLNHVVKLNNVNKNSLSTSNYLFLHATGEKFLLRKTFWIFKFIDKDEKSPICKYSSKSVIAVNENHRGKLTTTLRNPNSSGSMFRNPNSSRFHGGEKRN